MIFRFATLFWLGNRVSWEKFGGTTYSPSSSKEGGSTTVPHLTPHEPVEKPVWISHAERREATFVSHQPDYPTTIHA